jgi:hypothetical protein
VDSGQFELTETAGRLVLRRTRLSRLVDVVGLTLLIALGVAGGLGLLLGLFPGALWAAVVAALGVGSALAVYVFAVRYYREASRRSEYLLDRGGDRVLRGQEVLCATSAVERVEVRYRERGEDSSTALVLVLSPVARPGPGELVLGEFSKEDEAQGYAARIGSYLDVDVAQR